MCSLNLPLMELKATVNFQDVVTRCTGSQLPGKNPTNFQMSINIGRACIYVCICKYTHDTHMYTYTYIHRSAQCTYTHLHIRSYMHSIKCNCWIAVSCTCTDKSMSSSLQTRNYFTETLVPSADHLSCSYMYYGRSKHIICMMYDIIFVYLLQQTVKSTVCI